MGLEWRSIPLDIPSNLQEKPIAKTSTLNPVRQYVMVCAVSKGRVISLVNRRAFPCHFKLEIFPTMLFLG